MRTENSDLGLFLVATGIPLHGWLKHWHHHQIWSQSLLRYETESATSLEREWQLWPLVVKYFDRATLEVRFHFNLVNLCLNDDIKIVIYCLYYNYMTYIQIVPVAYCISLALRKRMRSEIYYCCRVCYQSVWVHHTLDYNVSHQQIRFHYS